MRRPSLVSLASDSEFVWGLNNIVDFDPNELPIRTFTSADAEFSLETSINVPLFERLTGYNMTKYPINGEFDISFSCPHQIQRKRHKRKRINKKWAKRYGYKTVVNNLKINSVEIFRSEREFTILGKECPVYVSR